MGGYTFTQSVVKLLTLLREGRHFDTVIFYDGANDIDYAYENGEAGGLADERTVRVRLEGGVWEALREAGRQQINSCALCFGSVVLVRHTPWLKDHLTPSLVRLRDAVHSKERSGPGDELIAMAEGIAQYYARSHGVLEALADAYRVRHLEFWQPSLLYEDTYAPGERPLADHDPRLTDPTLQALYRRSLERVVGLNLGNFTDISHALAGRTEACYLDAVHISGRCNRIVAERIYGAWREFLSGDRKAGHDGPTRPLILSRR